MIAAYLSHSCRFLFSVSAQGYFGAAAPRQLKVEHRQKNREQLVFKGGAWVPNPLPVLPVTDTLATGSLFEHDAWRWQYPHTIFSRGLWIQITGLDKILGPDK
jgi:hypothetical protein